MSLCRCFPCLKSPNDDDIKILDYSNCTLTDVPPEVFQFERTLEELYLSSNRIADLPPEIFYCQSLRILKANDNVLEVVPNAIGSLRQLQKLDLSRNDLTHIPDNVKLCKHLTHVDLSSNTLQRLPTAITCLITLQELFLNETCLEFLPANFGRLVNLKVLELRSNNLITLPKSMSRLINLIRIDIGANEFTELPEIIGQLIHLKELWIDYNRIRRISSNISNLVELVHFEANNNQLISIPNEIGSWKSLEVLSLSTNDIESIPFSIGMLSNLITLKCDSNQLKDLPDSICHLQNLEEIMIDHNFISRLPNTIGILRKLKFFAADENCLRRLPNEICSCTSLSVLSLQGNRLTELPHDIGHLTNLRVLNIVNNSIIHLPVSMLNLTQLQAMWISDNQSKPLVPLQYSEMKTQLTCFMLPQHTNNEQKQQQQTNRIIGQEYCPNYRNSPARRICFADESNPHANDTLTTRFMRSPTPYPKELRLMSKYVRNMNGNYNRNSMEIVQPTMQQPQHQLRTGAFDAKLLNESGSATDIGGDTCVIKEAKLLSSTNGSGSGGSSVVPSGWSDPHQYNNDNTTLSKDCDIDSAQNNKKVIDFSDDRYFYKTNIEPNFNVSTTPTSYDTYDGSTATTGTNQNVTLPTSQPNYHTLNGKFINSIGDNSSIDTNLRRTPPFDVPTISDVMQLYLQPSYDYELRQSQQQQHTQLLHPPPYHIAKAFTQKSREDLLNYDSIRNRVELCNDVVMNNILPPNENNQTSDIIDTRNSLILADNNYQFDGENNGNKCNNNNYDIGVYQNSNNTANNMTGSSSTTSSSDDSMHKFRPSPSPDTSKVVKSSSQWLFGLHKNPTVKQLSVRKEPTLGFEIKEIPNQGIYISDIVPNTCAASLLCIDDKILDVDGYGFSKICLEEARQVLIDSGPVLSIMISRK